MGPREPAIGGQRIGKTRHVLPERNAAPLVRSFYALFVAKF